MISSVNKSLCESYQSPDHTSNSPNHYKHQIEELRGCILQLQTKNRSIRDKYKQNLKLGFESKISTHRLECLMNRHFLKERRQAEVQAKTKEAEQEKKRRVRDQKLQSMSSRMYVNETLEERADRARNSLLKQKEVNQKKMLDNRQRESQRRRNLRSLVQIDKAESKRLRQSRRHQSQMKQRDIYAKQIKRELQQILEKEELLQKLQEELVALQSKNANDY